VNYRPRAVVADRNLTSYDCNPEIVRRQTGLVYFPTKFWPINVERAGSTVRDHSRSVIAFFAVRVYFFEIRLSAELAGLWATMAIAITTGKVQRLIIRS